MSFNSQYIVVIVLFLSAFNSSEGKDLTKIYGGGPALQNETLHQISIRIIENEEADGFGEGHNCGGTLISPLIVLTAAHCMYKRVFSLIPPFYKFEEYELDELYIVMGTLNRTERTNNTIVRATAAWKIHENYDREDMPFDIALIKLNESVPLDIPTIRPLTNLASTRVAAGTNCKVSGWGSIENNTFPELLLSVDVPIVDMALCNSTDSYAGILDDGMLCAGNMEEGLIDSCQGDSGGPFICNEQLVGVVSFGYECGRPSYPGVYSNVSYFREWISTNSDALLGINGTIKNGAIARSCFSSFILIALALFAYFSQ